MHSIRTFSAWSLRALVLTLAVTAIACSGGDSGDEGSASEAERSTTPASSSTPESATPVPTGTFEATAAVASADLPTRVPSDDPGVHADGLSATDIALEGIAARQGINSLHTHMEMFMSGGGTALSTTTDSEREGDTTYTASQTFGMNVEVLERPGETCIRVPGGEWQAQSSRTSGAATTNFGILGELIGPGYSDLVRLSDTTTEGGRDAYVLNANASSQALGAFDGVSPSDVLGSQVSMSIESSSIRVLIEKQTFYVLEVRLDTTFTLGEAEVGQVVIFTNDRHNEPARFPDDLPQSCSTLTS